MAALKVLIERALAQPTAQDQAKALATLHRSAMSDRTQKRIEQIIRDRDLVKHIKFVRDAMIAA